MFRLSLSPGLMLGAAALAVVGGLWMRPASAAGTTPVPEPMAAKPAKVAEATFAGGCFWCMESPYLKIKGVVEVMPGYSGGAPSNPTYEEVSSGTTGHAESVNIKYDPTQVSYLTLLEAYWRSIDPTDAGGQFADGDRNTVPPSSTIMRSSSAWRRRPRPSWK